MSRRFGAQVVLGAPKRDRGMENMSRIDKPFYSCLVLSHRCFFHCQMCVDWKAPAHTAALTFDACKRFVDSLADFINYRLEVNIMGGEPLMFDWVWPLCEHISQKGFTPIISTNGYLIDEGMAKKIVDSHLEVLAISLDGVKAETHDWVRGVKGSYARVMDALGYVHKYRRDTPHVSILTLILEKNLEELPALVQWAQHSGVVGSISFLPLLEFGSPKHKENWFRQPEYRHLWPQDVDKLEDTVDSLIALKRQGCKIFNPLSQLEAFKAYYRNPEQFLRETPYRIRDYVIDLDPTGEIFLSGYLLGAMKHGTRLKDLWFSEKANALRRQIDAYGCVNSRAKVISYTCIFQDDEPVADAVSMNKSQAGHHSQLGFFYQKQGKYDLAIAQFKKALEHDPRNADLCMGVAISYMQLKDYHAAIEAYNEASRLNPGVHDGSVKDAYAELGVSYQQEGKHELAIAYFKKALELDPQNAQLHVGLAINRLKLKEYKTAVEEYIEAFRLSSPGAQQDAMRDYAEALRGAREIKVEQKGGR